MIIHVDICCICGADVDSQDHFCDECKPLYEHRQGEEWVQQAIKREDEARDLRRENARLQAEASRVSGLNRKIQELESRIRELQSKIKGTED